MWAPEPRGRRRAAPTAISRDTTNAGAVGNRQGGSSLNQMKMMMPAQKQAGATELSRGSYFHLGCILRRWTGGLCCCTAAESLGDRAASVAPAMTAVATITAAMSLETEESIIILAAML